jgi:flagellar protein FlaI
MSQIDIDFSDVEDDLIEDMFDDNWNFKDSFVKDNEVVEHYSVSEYVDVKIMRHKGTDELVYYIDEPELTERENEIRYKVLEDMEEQIKMMDGIENVDRTEVADIIREKAKGFVGSHESLWNTYGNQILDSIAGGADKVEQYVDGFEKYRPEISLDNNTIEKVLYYVERDIIEYERLSPIFDDKFVEDVSCNGPLIPVFVYHNKYDDMISNIIYSKDELDLTVSSLAQRSGEHISIANPNVAGRLEGGYRLQLTLSDEISPKGSNFTIRKFKDEPFTPVDLIKFGTFSLRQMAYLWLAIENGKSLIFAGGTASGKTTSMNAVSLFIPPRSKVITIEDTQEIVLQHTNWVQTTTRSSFGSAEAGKVTMYELLRDALRQRPEYIIVGEIRGDEAQTLFQAMNTGHTTYSTMHADSVKSAINRLEHEPINLPRQMLNALDIISIQTTIEVENDTVRRCKDIVEIEDINEQDDTIKTRNVFTYNRKEDSIDSRVDSYLLEQIRKELNYSKEELESEIDNRMRLLNALLESETQYDYRQVTDIIRKYNRKPEQILERLD